jgi:3-hydroxyisobutyrate dehydrogenase-like beta-hydroxyacid dehydrogenase
MSGIAAIALLGFGEVGQALADDLQRHQSLRLSAWDVKFTNPASDTLLAARTRTIRCGASASDAARGTALVISAVTAAQTLGAAEAAAPGLAPGTWYLDLNSASPGHKQQAARAVEAAGGRYVEAAVMSPIHPRRSAAPILLGGPHAAAFAGPAQALGFSAATVFSQTLGAASAAKMCRSVIIKGLEAILTESLLTARHYQVDETVLASLKDLLPGHEWPKLAAYMISRSIAHGARRAEEMREVARTVSEAGLEPLMSEACARRQHWAAQFGSALESPALTAMLDAIGDTLARPMEQVAP